MSNAVASAIDHIGLTKIGNRFQIRPSAVQKWRDQGCLPQTELSGLTEYATGIEELCDGKFSAEQLLADTREVWLRRRRSKERSATRRSR